MPTAPRPARRALRGEERKLQEEAMAECAKTHDGISTEHMLMDRAPAKVLTKENGRYASLLTPIYRKYGIIGSESGLWGRFTG